MAKASTLGLLLFNMFIMDLHKEASSEVALDVDDIELVKIRGDCEELQKGWTKLSN